QAGRAVIASVAGARYWIATERAKTFCNVFPDCSFETDPFELNQPTTSRDDAILALVTGWMTHIGPTTASALGELLGIPASDIEKRSEEHTSELQSPYDLVCRLLLE